MNETLTVAEANKTFRNWLTVLTVWLIGVSILGGWSFVQAQNATDSAKNDASQAARLAQANTSLIGDLAIQAHKARLLAEQVAQARVQSCQRDNQRHAATIHAFDKLIAQAEHRAKTATRRFQIQQGARSTLLLIDALAPIRHC